MKNYVNGKVYHIESRYTEINSFLYKCTGISQIRNVSDTEFAIDYESDSSIVVTLFLKVDPDADAHFKRLVNAKVFFYFIKYRLKEFIVLFKIL